MFRGLGVLFFVLPCGLKAAFGDSQGLGLTAERLSCGLGVCWFRGALRI